MIQFGAKKINLFLSDGKAPDGEDRKAIINWLTEKLSPKGLQLSVYDGDVFDGEIVPGKSNPVAPLCILNKKEQLTLNNA